MVWLALALLATVNYLVGSFPTGVVFGRVFKGLDIRNYGSGKTGATNSLRTLGWKISLVVFILDMAKGAAAVLIAQLLFTPEYQPWAVLVAALASMVGHDHSIFIGFKGGRGAATGLGELLAVSPLALFFIALFGVPAVLLTGYVSLASIVGSALAPLGLLLAWQITGLDWRYVFFGLVCGGLIIFKHADNIERLLKGTERKLGQKAESAGPIPPSKQKQGAP